MKKLLSLTLVCHIAFAFAATAQLKISEYPAHTNLNDADDLLINAKRLDTAGYTTKRTALSNIFAAAFKTNFPQINVTNVASVGTLKATAANVSGTAAVNALTVTNTATVGALNVGTNANVAGTNNANYVRVTNSITAGSGTIATLNSTTGNITTLTVSNLTVTGTTTQSNTVTADNGFFDNATIAGDLSISGTITDSDNNLPIIDFANDTIQSQVIYGLYYHADTIDSFSGDGVTVNSSVYFATNRIGFGNGAFTTGFSNSAANRVQFSITNKPIQTFSGTIISNLVTTKCVGQFVAQDKAFIENGHVYFTGLLAGPEVFWDSTNSVFRFYNGDVPASAPILASDVLATNRIGFGTTFTSGLSNNPALNRVALSITNKDVLTATGTIITNHVSTKFIGPLTALDKVFVPTEHVYFSGLVAGPEMFWDSTNSNFRLYNGDVPESASLRVKDEVVDGNIQLGAGNIKMYSGTGVPAFVAPKGSIYLRANGTNMNTFFYLNTNGLSSGWLPAKLQ